MGFDKKDLVNTLNSSLRDLKQGIDIHCCLITSILGDHVEEEKLQPLLDMCPKRTREKKLEGAIKLAIEELEESRKSFKSKRLEALRKKLTDILLASD